MAKRKKIPKRPARKALSKPSSPKTVSKPRLRAGAPSKVSTVQPAKWFRDSVHRGWANDTQAVEYARRQSEVDYLRESIKMLRKFYRGFTASDGYSLRTREIVRLDAGKHAQISSLAAQLRKEMASDYQIVRPRSKRSKDALYKHTGASRYKAKDRKAFVAHVPNKHTQVKIEAPKGRGGAQVKEVTTRTGAETKRIYYYFADFIEDDDDYPRTMEDIIDLTREMLPKMRQGYYVFNSADYGFIAAPMYKDFLLSELSSRWLDYDRFSPDVSLKDSRGLAESLVGYTLVSTKLEGAKHEYRERQTRRVQYRKFKAQQRQEKQRRVRNRIDPRCTAQTKSGKRCTLARGHQGKHRF